jgi:hypothetical protein
MYMDHCHSTVFYKIMTRSASLDRVLSVINYIVPLHLFHIRTLSNSPINKTRINLLQQILHMLNKARFMRTILVFLYRIIRFVVRQMCLRKVMIYKRSYSKACFLITSLEYIASNTSYARGLINKGKGMYGAIKGSP